MNGQAIARWVTGHNVAKTVLTGTREWAVADDIFFNPSETILLLSPLSEGFHIKVGGSGPDHTIANQQHPNPGGVG